MLFTSGLNGSGFKVGVAKEQCRIGFQPVPRVHCTWPCEMETRREWLKAVAKSVRDTGWKPMVVRLRVRTNSGVEVPIGQNTGCP